VRRVEDLKDGDLDKKFTAPCFIKNIFEFLIIKLRINRNKIFSTNKSVIDCIMNKISIIYQKILFISVI